MKAVAATLLTLALTSCFAVAAERNCPEAVTSKACELISQDGSERTPGSIRSTEFREHGSKVNQGFSDQKAKV